MPITENSGKKESEEAGAGEEHGSPALQADTLPSEPPGKSLGYEICMCKYVDLFLPPSG